MPRAKQFDDLIEEHPDFMVLRDHITKTVTGEGNKIGLMGSVWRLARHAALVGRNTPSQEKVEDVTLRGYGHPGQTPTTAKIGPSQDLGAEVDAASDVP